MRLNREAEKYLTDGSGDRITISNNAITPYGMFVTQMGMTKLYLGGTRMYITEKRLRSNYETVENFSVIEYSEEKKGLITYMWIYKDKVENYYIGVVKDDQEEYGENESETNEEGVYKIIELYYDSTDEHACENTVNLLNTRTIRELNSEGRIAIALKTTHGYVFKDHKIKPKPIDLDIMYNEDFRDVHSIITEALKNESKGLVMLHGTAGTGKTNYIKYLSKLILDKKFIFVPVSMILSLSDPEFMSALIESGGSVLVLEDCEKYIQDREIESNGIVSTILNLADGLLSDVLGVQIICTFNANLSKVDEALLRKGRLIAEYEFSTLSDDRAKKLMESLGIDTTETNFTNKTLAEITNASKKTIRTQAKQRKIGF